MPFQWKRIVHLILYFLTIFVVVIVKNSIFHLITVGCSTCMIMMMNASGAEGGASSSSSFFEGLSDLVKNPAEPGINSQSYQGAGQRLPGPLEISSPGISGESLFRELEQPRREPDPQPEAAPPAHSTGGTAR